MAVYTVHEPPLKRDQREADPERFDFVRDGFSFWAFLLTPIWMLWRRLWLVFVMYLLVMAGLQIVLDTIGATASARVTVMLLASLLVGLEAATLRRFTLARRHWTNVGIVVGDDLESAERRFFDAWSRDDWAGANRPASGSIHRAPRAAAAAAATAMPVLQRPPDTSGVIGLFPESGASR
jgi:Protein of unknown function (DUF2628)